MNKKKRRIIIIGSIITFIVVPVITATVLSITQPKKQADERSTTKLASRSEAELAEAIIDQQPTLIADGKPIFTITNTDRSQQGWYIITMRQNNDPKGTNPAKVLLQDSIKDGLRFIIGPGTYFPPETMESLGIPNSVTEALNA